ncbi:hypothetical protein ACIQU4_27330 [Streptomyces sp. NPDC090741]|uniref:hypothetical protein n=1 Tax=Streptomyces sp. NPDC090741 TaxID=3365967 RepID=UPI0037F610F2
MSAPPPDPASAPEPSAPPPAAATAPGSPAASGRLGAAEAAIVITAVTVLAVLERPVPALLTTLAAGTLLVLLPGRAGGRLLAVLHALTAPRP